MGKTFEALMKAEKDAANCKGTSSNRDQKKGGENESILGNISSQKTDRQDESQKDARRTQENGNSGSHSYVANEGGIPGRNLSIKEESEAPERFKLEMLDELDDMVKSKINHREFFKIKGMPEPVDIEKISEELYLQRKKLSKLGIKKVTRKKRKKRRKTKLDLLSLKKPDSIISENFKIIRSRIINLIRGRDIRSILITSATPTEGKSFIASNLAASMSQGFEKYVLLVDADLRRPAQGEIYEMSSDLGLTDYLIDVNIDFSDLLIKTKTPKLSILPSGSAYANQSEIISSKIMELFIQEVKYRYDDRYVIFDAPPLPVAETMDLANSTDGVILVINSQKTDRRLVLKAVQTIGREKIIGIILNHCNAKNSSYGYHGY